jgi:hypothetical protein
MANGQLIGKYVSDADVVIVEPGPGDFPPKADPLNVLVEPIKIDSLLEAQIARAEVADDSSATAEVIVTFVENLKIPRFPDADEDEPRDSLFNTTQGQRAQQMVDDIRRARDAEHARLSTELSSQHRAKVKETFWLINGMVIEIPLNEVRSLAARSDVRYVENVAKLSTPPTNLMVDARNDMGTDVFFNMSGMDGGWIGMLDTGVHLPHTLLTNIGYRMDCTNELPPSCSSFGDLNDDIWNHGTSSASIITANANLGNNNRGITKIVVDSFNVFKAAGFDINSGIRGFQEAIVSLDRVIMANIQEYGTEDSSLASAADNAFWAGAVVVAATGNYGPAAGSVRCPANAQTVLGIGDVNVNNVTFLFDESGRGPCSDGRIKPDIVAPSPMGAASNSPPDGLRTFGGTSASTPSAAGAVALLRNYMRGLNFEIDPGFVNAAIIASGQNTAGPAYDNNIGAGLPVLPYNGNFWVSSVVVTPGQTVDVPITVSAPITYVDGAIWWPEALTTQHNDIDLALVSPSGTTIWSDSVTSVFEKVRVTTGLAAGTWKVRIRYWGGSGSQTVYWSMFRHF